MADTKASAESAAAALDGTEIVRIVQTGSTVRTTTQAIRDLVGTFSGALVKKTASQTTADYTAGVLVAWDAEVYDVGGWHDNVTANTRLTVPAGVTRVRLNAQVHVSSIAADTYVRASIAKNGVTFGYDGVAAAIVDPGESTMPLSISSPVLVVIPGDYFELWLDTESDTSITVTSPDSWFAIQKVS